MLMLNLTFGAYGCIIIMYYVHVCIYVTMKEERCVDRIYIWIFNLIYLEITEVIPVPLALMK